MSAERLITALPAIAFAFAVVVVFALLIKDAGRERREQRDREDRSP